MLVVVAIAAVGIGAMLLTMAAAIRHGLKVAELETRVKYLRAQHRLRLIERGMIEPDDDELGEVEMDEAEEVIEAVPIDDEPASAGRVAA